MDTEDRVANKLFSTFLGSVIVDFVLVIPFMHSSHPGVHVSSVPYLSYKQFSLYCFTG